VQRGSFVPEPFLHTAASPDLQVTLQSLPTSLRALQELLAVPALTAPVCGVGGCGLLPGPHADSKSANTATAYFMSSV
jgi:hypothetical protein